VLLPVDAFTWISTGRPPPSPRTAAHTAAEIRDVSPAGILAGASHITQVLLVRERR
jgi:hypothetical protein